MIVQEQPSRSGRRRLIALVPVLALVAAGCADDSAGGSGGTSGDGPAYEGLPFDASKADFQEALADMDPVTLIYQSSAAQGASTGWKFEQYAEAVEDWSGGAITIEMHYANAAAPPDEVDRALVDGRLDLGSVLGIYDPDRYPVTNVFTDIAFVGPQQPVLGLLAYHAAANEVAFGTPEFHDEFAEHGMSVLLPAAPSPPTTLACTEPATSLAELQGRDVAAGSVTHVVQAEALGMSPVSMAYPEIYESLQRGVVDCTLSSMTVINLGGFAEVAPYVSFSPEVGFAQVHGTNAINTEVLADLPLTAQQLLFDRGMDYIEWTLRGSWNDVAEAMAVVEASGGSVEVFDAEASSALSGANDGLLAEAAESPVLNDGSAFVDTFVASFQGWTERLSELGYADEPEYNEFVDWYDTELDSFDFDTYFEVLWDEVFNAHRPA